VEEQDYIKRIAEMQAEIDKDNELIGFCYDRIEQLNLELALANSSFTKNKKVSAKQVKEYESKMAEYNAMMDIVSPEMLLGKKNELDEYLKRIISVNSKFNSLKNQKRIPQVEIDDLESEISDISEEMLCKYISVVTVLLRLKGCTDMEEMNKDISELTSNLDIFKEVIAHKNKQIRALTSENNWMRADITNSTGGSETHEDLRNIIKHKDMEIKVYKEKIARLETEIQKNK
jgi:predicted  nucleic acid-binding Zn-ribbon protein